MPEESRPPDANLTTNSNFLNNLLLFGRLLRGLGMDVNPGRMIDLVQALDHIDIGRRDDFYHASRGLLVHKREDIPLFDEAFELFWRRPVEEWASLDIGTLLQQRKNRPRFIPPPLQSPAPENGGQDGKDAEDSPPLIQITQTFSRREILRQKDFAEMSGEEMEAVKRLISQLALKLGERRTRRTRPGRGGQRLDLRRSLRKSHQTGGEIIFWARREPKFKPRPLVIIADISGSMERYTRLLLHFIYGLAHALHQPVESFVFSTRLTRITRQLHHKNIDQALGEVSHIVHDWGGGTRTGESLKCFNFDWARRVLGRGAVILIISDGWDRGDVELLRREMARLQRSCYRLVWLNPLLGSPVYEPLTRGIQSALPYIDDFLPVHNLASLEDLAAHLAKVGVRR